jgi:hypothetical protein
MSNASQRTAIVLVTSLFFLWALAHNLNPILIPHLRKALQLNDMRSALVDSAFFIAYFVMALPAGALMKRYGYKAGIVGGLLLFATGTFLFWPAATLRSYPVLPQCALHHRQRPHLPGDRRQPVHQRAGRSGHGTAPIELRAGVQRAWRRARGLASAALHPQRHRAHPEEMKAMAPAALDGLLRQRGAGRAHALPDDRPGGAGGGRALPARAPARDHRGIERQRQRNRPGGA